MTDGRPWLPDTLSLDGAWQDAVARLYDVFEKDFVLTVTAFEGREVWFNRRIEEGERYEEGFWHLVSKDDRITGERLPDFPRAKRLPWCAPLIRNSDDPSVKNWDYEEGSGRIRTYLWLEDADYVVILEKRSHKKKDVAFLVTAYFVGGDSQKRGLRRKYDQGCR